MSIGATTELRTAITRLTPPVVRTGTLLRQRLVDRVLGADCSLVVVHGPAGSGKSGLLAQVHAQAPGAAWLSASHQDDDPAVFWTALIEGIAQLLPGFAGACRHQLDVDGAAAVDDVVPHVVNELALSATPVTLLIDDCDLIAGRQTQQSIADLLELVPANVRVVLAGRSVPRVPIARIRLSGDLLELDERDLALTSDEAVQVLAASGVDLPPAQLEVVLDRAEGWTAAIAWIATGLRLHDSTGPFVESMERAEGHLADYLVEEVIDRLSPEERRFMLETSILSTFTAGLCDAVRGRNDSAALIERLVDQSAFVVSVGGADRWHRYHHIVQEVLLTRLRVERPDVVAELRRRASGWHRDRGDVVEAIRHAVDAEELIDAADLLTLNWFELANTGRIETAARLFDLLHPQVTRSYLPLTIAAAMFFSVSGDVTMARHFYDLAQRSAPDGAPPGGGTDMRSGLALMRCSLALDGVASALRDAEFAYSVEGPNSPMRAPAALQMGLSLAWRGEPARARPYFEEVVATATPERGLIVYALAELALVELAGGDLASASEHADRACSLVEASGSQMLFMAATANAARGLVACSAGDHRGAERALRAAGPPADRVSRAMPVDSMRIHVLLADVATRLGLVRLAAAHVRTAEVIDAEIDDTGVLTADLDDIRARLDEMTAADKGSLAFSERELDVLRLLPSGATTREIAAQLFVSMNTIKSHLRRIYQELNVSDRATAIARARESGFL